jgi:hypothetical protein
MKSFFIKLGLTTFNNHHFSFERKNNLYHFKFIYILEWKSLSLDMIYSYRKMSLRELFQNINCVFVDYGIEHLPEKIHNEKLTLSLFDYCDERLPENWNILNLEVYGKFHNYIHKNINKPDSFVMKKFNNVVI